VPDDSPIQDPYAPREPDAAPVAAPEAPPPGPTAASPRAPASPTAIASVVLAVLPCLPVIGGLLGVALGIMARGDIERSQGQRGGTTLANAGIVLGALHLIFGVALFGAGLVYLSGSSPTATYTPPHPAPPPPIPTALTPTPPPAPSPQSPAPAPRASRDEGVSITRVGDITVVDIGPDVTPLTSELARQRHSAEAADQKLVLWLVVPDCKPCNGVSAALADPAMQTALQQVRLVRLNVRDFYLQLKHLNVPVEKIPGFALLGSDFGPSYYVHGGEWDADIARNIAPVLGKFVRGEYKHRRDPWRGGARDDETPL